MSKENTPTPHNAAKYGEIAETVLMAGDPLRAKLMAEKFLENPVQYNTVRGMLGYTGTYHGKRVSVQGHGMGIPSIGIYTYELFHFYDVQQIVRVGSAGALVPDLHVGDLVIAMGACTDSNYGHQFDLPCRLAPVADFSLLRRAVEAAEKMEKTYRVGTIYSSDVFYDPSDSQKKLAAFGVLAVEMETSGLYINAAEAGRKALTICTVSDNLVTGECASAEKRQNSFTDMMEVAFELI